MTDPYAWHSVSDLIDLARKHTMPTEPGTLGWKPAKPQKLFVTVRDERGVAQIYRLIGEQADAL